jgi:hypothetical protein
VADNLKVINWVHVLLILFKRKKLSLCTICGILFD